MGWRASACPLWNINSTGRRSSNKNGEYMICGSFKNLTRDIVKSLMNAISKKKFKGSKGGATSLRECLPHQIQLLNPKVTTSNVTHLDGTDLARVKDDFLLQKSFAREAKNFFESERRAGRLEAEAEPNSTREGVPCKCCR